MSTKRTFAFCKISRRRSKTATKSASSPRLREDKYHACTQKGRRTDVGCEKSGAMDSAYDREKRHASCRGFGRSRFTEVTLMADVSAEADHQPGDLGIGAEISRGHQRQAGECHG